VKRQALAEGADRHRAVRLRQHVDRPCLEGVERRLRAGLRQRTHDHHRQRMVLHQDPQERQAVHPRHLEVERQHVGIEPGDLLSGHVGVARRAHHLDLGIRRERVGDRLADERRVVDDEHAESAGGGECHRGCCGTGITTAA
jgi:hypothetical protein